MGTWSYRTLGRSQKQKQMTEWGRGSSGHLWATGGSMESRQVPVRFQSETKPQWPRFTLWTLGLVASNDKPKG